jgi:type I restriction enzyme S subunit
MADKFYAYIEPLQSGAAYPAVTDGIVKSYIIPIPPLSEQQHIVEELDLLSSIIEKKKAQLKELDNLAHP